MIGGQLQTFSLTYVILENDAYQLYVGKEIVKSRLEVGISYTEFSYMILQAGDFWNLRSKYGCVMQIGGGDQWGNLTTALDFVKKKEGEKCPCQVFSVKLICDSNGKKFGKSEKVLCSSILL